MILVDLFQDLRMFLHSYLQITIPHLPSQPIGDSKSAKKEKEERVADMTEEEREDEIQQILERFGSSVGDVLKRARLARETKSVTGKTAGTIDTSGEHHSQGHSTPNLINFLVFNLRNS